MRWREWPIIVAAGGTPNTKSARWRLATTDEMENGWLTAMDDPEPTSPSADEPSKNDVKNDD